MGTPARTASRDCEREHVRSEFPEPAHRVWNAIQLGRAVLEVRPDLERYLNEVAVAHRGDVALVHHRIGEAHALRENSGLEVEDRVDGPLILRHRDGGARRRAEYVVVVTVEDRSKALARR